MEGDQIDSSSGTKPSISEKLKNREQVAAYKEADRNKEINPMKAKPTRITDSDDEDDIRIKSMTCAQVIEKTDHEKVEDTFAETGDSHDPFN